MKTIPNWTISTILNNNVSGAKLINSDILGPNIVILAGSYKKYSGRVKQSEVIFKTDIRDAACFYLAFSLCSYNKLG